MKNKTLDSHTDQLWQRILAFELDEPNVALPFSKRLARENGWSRHYTFRALKEYKRFMFLVCLSPQSVTPSVSVDAVWHLHLLYTKSYWEDFCGTVLERPVHHNPTKGGAGEGQKFKDNYTRTLALYETHFGTKPPEDLWQPIGKRFKMERWQWINLNEYWLVSKSCSTFWNYFLSKLKQIPPSVFHQKKA